MNQESETLEFFGPLLADPSKIKREAVHRRKQFDEKSIVAEEIPGYEADGWQVDRRLKRSNRVKRPKAIDERLENRFWMLLARLGYPEINSGRKFTMLIDRKGAEPLRKQVDVFAKDDETVIVAECKASGTGSAAVVEGSIASFGSQYVVGLRATNCCTGDLLDEEQVQAARKEDGRPHPSHRVTRT